MVAAMQSIRTRVKEDRSHIAHFGTALHVLQWIGSRRVEFSRGEFHRFLTQHSSAYGMRSAHRYLETMMEKGWVERTRAGWYRSRITVGVTWR